MPRLSPYKIDIPECNILSYLFPKHFEPTDRAIWMDAAEPQKKSLSPKQLLSWCRRLGYGFHSQYNLQGQDVVMVLSHNHVFVPVAYLGISGSGLIYSGCNPAYSAREVARQIADTGCKLILVEPKLLKLALEALDYTNFPKDRLLLFSDDHCTEQRGIVDWRERFKNTDDAESWQWPQLDGSAAVETTAVLNYSSGTTGLPKGVMISHKNVIANVEQSLFMRNLGGAPVGPDEHWLGFLPLYHAFGQLWTIVAACRAQVPCYMMPEFEFQNFLANIEKHRITHLQTAPPILVMLNKRPECASYDLSSLKNILCGAAPLSSSLQNEVSDRFELSVVQTYGMTELTCSTFHVPGNCDDRSGKVGLLDPNCEVKLVNVDGKEVGDGEPGEVRIRGPNVCLGYWRNSEATSDLFDSERFLKTGDIGVCDSKGWYAIVDRIKELIKVNGFQVAPAELEALLLEHPGVGDAAVVGLQLPEEERPRAYVVAKPLYAAELTEKVLQNWVKSRVAKHKQLTGGISFVEHIPKSPSGKIQRTVIRKWAAEQANSLRNTKDAVTKAKL